MEFGICTSIDRSAAARAAGFAYVEESVQGLLQGTISDGAWQGPAKAAGSALPIRVCNMLVPAHLKITGPSVDRDVLQQYMSRVSTRAGQVGIQSVVFGSAGARQVPNGFDRDEACQQIIRFLCDTADALAAANVTLVIEPLNRGECNIINRVAEAMQYVHAVNHPSIQCLVDSYHFWLEDEPLDNLRAAMPWIKHVHMADKVGRVAPGLSRQSDYRPFFKVLKAGGYDGMISFEGKAIDDFDAAAPRVIDYVRSIWKEA